MKKRLLSVLLALIVVLGLLPTTAFAGETPQVKVIQLGTGGIQDPKEESTDDGTYYSPNSYVYFGVNSNNNTPIKWRVLDADKTNNNTSGMFLLSEYLLENNVKFNDSNLDGSLYQGSKAQEWCRDFANNTRNFTMAEQGAMLGITKNDSGDSVYSREWGASCLSSDKLFFLSVRELAGYVGNYKTAPGLAATAGSWWLRSPDSNNEGYNAGMVKYDGNVYQVGAASDLAARPAFNLNLDSVLFTSAAVDGKAASGMNRGLTAVPGYTGNEWKVTLKDASRDFAVTETTATEKAGGKITLTYTGANVGANEYISVILEDKDGNITHYGRVLKPEAANGTVDITIPSSLAEGTYTLHVFSEQYNGNYKTDYASKFDKVTLTIHDHVWSEDWNSDETAHWHDCTAANCPNTGNSNKGGYAEHSGGTATCTTPAICSICGATYGTVKADNHTNLTHVDAVEATEITEGNIEYWHCEGCGKYYKDEAATQPTTPAETVTPKLNHTHVWGNWTSSGNGTHSRSCTGCTESQTENCSGGTATCTTPATCSICGATYGTVKADNHTNLTHVDAVEATETTEGNIEYWHCDGCDKYYSDEDAKTEIRREDTVTTGSAVPATGLTLSMKKLTLVPNGKIPLTAVVKPTNSTDSVTWSSSDPMVVTVSDTGEVKAVGYGTATITAKAGSKIATCQIIVVCGTDECQYYDDIEAQAWYHPAVDYVTQVGIMQGKGNKIFDPEVTLTRAEMAQIFYNYQKEVVNGGKEPTQGTTQITFSDVKSGEWYEKAIQWASSNDIILGDGEADGNTFRPNAAVSREEMVTMLYRYMVTFSKKLPLPASGAEEWKEFPDSENVADWAEIPFAWAVHYGIINGDDGYLRPQNTATRAQAAKIMMVAVKQ